MKSCGLKYDSSVFPIVHDLGGFPNAPRHPYEIKEGLWEFPLSTFRLLGKNWPVAGGGYLRLYPYWFTKWIIERLNKRGQPAVVYVHPWEFDPDQPRFDDAPLLSRFRHYQNLDKTEKKLKALFRDFEFAPIKDVLDNWISQNG
jgi:polysaccharide deacetylase family protein (PEP-CTERM system associated)